MDKSLTSITKEMIVKRHTEHGQERSQARANLAMRVLRAIFNFAINEYENAKGANPLLVTTPSNASLMRVHGIASNAATA